MCVCRQVLRFYSFFLFLYKPQELLYRSWWATTVVRDGGRVDSQEMKAVGGKAHWTGGSDITYNDEDTVSEWRSR
jgi:beta-glucosidase-like glycosyl hydrolase